VCEVRFDGLRTDPELVGDLAVPHSGGGELGDAALGWGEVLCSWTVPPKSLELGAGPAGPDACPELVERPECRVQSVAGVAPRPHLPQDLAAD
jgi:hypothetical protein